MWNQGDMALLIQFPYAITYLTTAPASNGDDCAGGVLRRYVFPGEDEHFLQPHLC